MRFDKEPDQLVKGEGIMFNRPARATQGLILCCPNCGHTSSGPHTYDEKTRSLTPSIRCGKCKWHGFLTDGKFRNA